MWNEDRATLDFYREGSDPKAFDVEYSVEYTLRWRRTDDDAEAETDGPLVVTFYADADAAGVVIAWDDLTPETRAAIDAAVKAGAKSEARDFAQVGGYWSPLDDDADAAYETARDDR